MSTLLVYVESISTKLYCSILTINPYSGLKIGRPWKPHGSRSHFNTFNQCQFLACMMFQRLVSIISSIFNLWQHMTTHSDPLNEPKTLVQSPLSCCLHIDRTGRCLLPFNFTMILHCIFSIHFTLFMIYWHY